MDIRSLSEEFTALLEVRTLTDNIKKLYSNPVGAGQAEQYGPIVKLGAALRDRMEARILAAADKPEDYLPDFKFHATVYGDLQMLEKAHEFADIFWGIAYSPDHSPADIKIAELASAYLGRVEERLKIITKAKNLNDFLPDAPKPAKKAREL